jgi:integrase
MAFISCRPKTARSRRIVPLPNTVVEALKLRREQQETDRLAAGVELWEDWGLVLTTRFGTPLSPRHGYREFQRLVAAAGLRRVRLHDLRHTAASLMLAQGVNPRVVMEILGYSQISITRNTYSHVAPASSPEALARVEGLLFECQSELE